jgi:hypothetical protein
MGIKPGQKDQLTTKPQRTKISQERVKGQNISLSPITALPVVYGL